MKRINFTCIIFIALGLTAKSQVTIKMQDERGVYTTPCIVNGLKLKFIFDTGASNVSISLSEALFMLKNGYLDENDLHGSSYSQLADGDIIENTSVNLRELEIGGIKIYDVEATIIHELSAPLLLGQSAIKQLGKIQLEGDKLILLEVNISSNENQCNQAFSLIVEAEDYYYNNLYSLASYTFQKAYNLCPSIFGYYDIYLMGSSYFYKNDYEKAIEFLKKAERNNFDKSLEFSIASKIGSSYMNLKYYQEAELYYEKALSIASNDDEKYKIYFDLGFLKFQMNKHQKAIDYFNESQAYFIRLKNINYEKNLRENNKNKVLGIINYLIGLNYIKLNQFTNAEMYIYTAKKFGNEDAIEYCGKYNIYFEMIN